MHKFRLCRFFCAIIALAALFLVLLATHNEAETPGEPLSAPAHVERGNRAARHYDAYSRQLAQYHSSLTRALRESAPELLVHLQPRPPIVHGYQILPRITADAGSAEYVNTNVAYSWPWTDHLIDEGQRAISRSDAELRKAMTSVTGGRVLQRLALEYHQLNQQHRNLDAHIQYNRLWQSAIAANRRAYDKETALHDQIFEHQRILDRLARTRVALDRFNGTYSGPDRFPELTTSLSGREALLRGRIGQALDDANPPDFVKIENSRNEWVVRVPLLTDIEDREFVDATKKIIETTWMSADGHRSYRVELDISFISVDILYGKAKRPVTGQNLEMRRHLQRFPAGTAILTTGAFSTHVQDNAIVLGPHDLSPRVLAHEFGHILGFRDLYVRGYKDLAEDGFEVMEVVSDPQDIMAATPQGKVASRHFLRLIESSARNLAGAIRAEFAGGSAS
jgi:hypothetical protein